MKLKLVWGLGMLKTVSILGAFADWTDWRIKKVSIVGAFAGTHLTMKSSVSQIQFHVPFLS